MKGIHDLRGRKFVGKSRRTTFRASLGQFGQKKQKICMAATPMIQVTFFFFRDLHVLTAVTSVSEVIVIFLQLILFTFCKHSCVLLFFAQISLTLFLRRQQR